VNTEPQPIKICGGGCCGNSSGASSAMTQTNFHLFPASYTTFLRWSTHPLAILCFDIVSIAKHRDQQIFQKSRNHLQILGLRSVKRSNFGTEDPQFWSYEWTSLLSGALCSVHVYWYPFLYVMEGGDCNNYAANMMHHHIKFSHLGGQMAQICAPNLAKSIQEAIFICLLLLATVEFL